MSILNRVWKGGISMSISKKLNEQIYKYTGVIFSLFLMWTLSKHQEDLTAENFLASAMI